MKKRTTAAAITAAVLALSSCGTTGSTMFNDYENGIVRFKNITKTSECGIELEKGDNLLTLTLNEGSLHMTIGQGDDLILDRDFIDSETFTVTAPEEGLYMLDITGKKASGLVDYIVKIDSK